MKFFRKKAAAAFVTALSLMASSMAPVFAEGSKEMTAIPEGDETLASTSGTEAHRPYLDWRDRTQFGMPSENVINVYANAGETIFFGSDVTNASDRSIEAVVQKACGQNAEDSFVTSLNIPNDAAYKGASIAVTLPESNTAAFNPEDKENGVFVDGSELTAGADTNKVYLFKVTENGKGHIANRDMEKNGPNGVNGTTNGYEPLSFVAPYTGTYAFRFLSSEYAKSDIPVVEGMNEKNRKLYATIDFDGAEVKSMTDNEMYYEENLGFVTLYNESNRGASIKELGVDENITVPATDFSEEKTYEQGKKYLSKSGNATHTGGSIGFTPLHSNIELEIVWQKIGTDDGRRRVYIAQNGRTSQADITNTGVNVSKINSIGGYPIEAGKEIRIYTQGTNSGMDANIYEIRYFYDQTVLPEQAVPTPTPTPTPTPVPTATPIAHIKNLDWQSLDVKNSSGNQYTEAVTISSDTDLYSATVNSNFRVGSISTGKIIANNNYAEGYKYLWPLTNVNITITPSHDNAKIEIDWEPAETISSSDGRITYISVNGVRLESLSSTAEGKQNKTSEILNLSADTPVNISFDRQGGNIYAIRYIWYEQVDATASPAPADAATDEPATVSLMEAEPTQKVLSQSRFWDFYDIASGTTYSNGSLYDEYLKVINADMTTSGGYIPLSGNGFEFTPAYSGSVEAVFELGGGGIMDSTTIVIEQGEVKATSEPSMRKDTGVAKLDIKANEPVKIYKRSGSARLKSIRYTAGGENLENFARKVDEPWANSPSEVAAWDVTVAKKTEVSNDTTPIVWNLTADVTDYSTEVTAGDKTSKLTIKNNAGASTDGVKINKISSVPTSAPTEKYLSFTPKTSGKLEVLADTNAGSGGTADIYVWQDGKQISGPNTVAKNNSISFTVNVVANIPLYIYSAGSSSNNGRYKTITFTPDAASGGITTNDSYTAIPGRAWADILFLNAGMYQKSMYSKLNILTKRGFLYDFKFNGIQPYGFVFYSNNRGFLYDPYSYSEWSDTNDKSLLQPLERSFLSKGNFDVGDAPVREEKDANGNPIIYEGRELKSRVLGNYIPEDTVRDYTHKLFFNKPDSAAVLAYTGNADLKGEGSNIVDTTGQIIVNSIEYTGSGDWANNNGEIHYGTLGIGGKFTFKLSEDNMTKLKAMGASSISVVLDFSRYALDENNKPITEKDTNGRDIWKTATGQNGAEQHNKVNLTKAIVEAGTYTMSWDGKDAYGNIVPEGEYSNNVASFIELGTAHFPILDAEHNPNGIKLQMANKIGSGDKDIVYYKNSAVSPQIKEAPTNWLYANWESAEKTPSKIGDGLNHIDGVKSNYDTYAANGAMKFGSYETDADKAINKNADAGYGNYAALDIWTKYDIRQEQNLSFGVKAAESVPAYVSFVAENGTAGPTDSNTDLTESHLKFRGAKLAGDSSIKGKDDIYGNTISTGFLTTVKSGIVTKSAITWEITIPSSPSEDKNYGGTYIKQPIDNGNTTSLDAAELYNTLFGVEEDTVADDDVLNVGDEVSGNGSVGTTSSDNDMVDMNQGIDESNESFGDEAAQQFLLEVSDANENATTSDNTEIKVDANAVLTDTSASNASGTQIYNAGAIHRVSFEGMENKNYKIKLKQDLIITGNTEVVIGLVIDNLYAPNATAKAAFDGDGEVESAYQTIQDAIDSTNYQNYLTNEKNQYDATQNVNYKDPSSKK